MRENQLPPCAIYYIGSVRCFALCFAPLGAFHAFHVLVFGLSTAARGWSQLPELGPDRRGGSRAGLERGGLVLALQLPWSLQEDNGWE